jgi:hypothetical protein
MSSSSTLWLRELRKNSPEKYRLRLVKRAAWTHSYFAEMRRRAIEILGGKCVRCGFSDPRALQIDHVNGGGTKEIRVIQNFGIYRKILDGNTSDYQLLCANCNWIKRAENHETKNCGKKGKQKDALV